MKQFLSILLIACVLVACDAPVNNSTKHLNLSPAQKEMVAKSNDFSFNLLRQIGSEQQDFFISPLSASFALAMLANGAAGETQVQILDMLGYDTTSLAELNDYHSELLTVLPKLETSTKVDIANAIFVQNDFPISTTYKQDMQDQYKAKVQNVDFSAPATVDLINKWASANTNKRIKKIVSPGDFTSGTSMVLANALSFIGKWDKKFDSSATKKENFNNADGTTTEVDMMHITEDFTAGRAHNYYVLQMPYKNKAYEMVVLLPVKGADISDVLDSLDAETWLQSASSGNVYDDEISGIFTREVSVKMPKFTYEYNRDLTNDLQRLGMKNAFQTTADFSVMSPETGIMVSKVCQNTYLSIDEQGTEAHAVTGIIMGPTDAGPDPNGMYFYVDEPFIFFIRERACGTILFAGIRSKM